MMHVLRSVACLTAAGVLIAAGALIVSGRAAFAQPTDAEIETGAAAPASQPEATSPMSEAPAVAAVSSTNNVAVKMAAVSIFVLAIFVGFEIINKVPTTLHTPLMSGSNAISGITIVGALLVILGGGVGPTMIGFVTVVLASINAVGGFIVTDRMLRMFRRR